jgi:hypothetical protein
MRGMDWDAEARRMAEHVLAEMIPDHRGAMPWRKDGISVVFGNDPDAEDLQVKEVATRVCEILVQIGVKVLGFGVDRLDGLSWAILVESGDIDMLTRLVRLAWKGGDPGSIPAPLPVARTPINRSEICPGHSAN